MRRRSGTGEACAIRCSLDRTLSSVCASASAVEGWAPAVRLGSVSLSLPSFFFAATRAELFNACLGPARSTRGGLLLCSQALGAQG
ncbi:hypothetical protein [Synechococcus sp. UW140]|uniref:hypothetical protein n=1 Tax=Synechococcus sp. UW140 TaxID=368503 RepID=UPI000E0ED9C5|nr:hypothetical protein [Synechococcus sp. UW140]